MNDWTKFVKEQKETDLKTLIEDENLNEEETRKFIDNSFRDGQVKTTGTDIEKILPPMRRFGEILTNAGSFSGSFVRPDMKTVAQNMFDAYKNSEAHYNNMIAGEYNFVGTSIISYKNNGMITCHNITVFTEE